MALGLFARIPRSELGYARGPFPTTLQPRRGPLGLFAPPRARPISTARAPVILPQPPSPFPTLVKPPGLLTLPAPARRRADFELPRDAFRDDGERPAPPAGAALTGRGLGILANIGRVLLPGVLGAVLPGLGAVIGRVIAGALPVPGPAIAAAAPAPTDEAAALAAVYGTPAAQAAQAAIAQARNVAALAPREPEREGGDVQESAPPEQQLEFSKGTYRIVGESIVGEVQTISGIRTFEIPAAAFGEGE